MAGKSIKSKLKQFFYLFILVIFLSIICTGINADNGTIQGYIKDPGGKPLEGITIEAYDAGDKTTPAAKTKTGNDGFYSLTLKRGTYEVKVIGGGDSWIYQHTESDYVRDVIWRPQPVKVTDNSVSNISLSMSITPWDWIAAAIIFVLCLIIFDQILLRRNIHLIGLINTLFFRLRHRITNIYHSPAPVPEAAPDEKPVGTYAGIPSKKADAGEGTYAGIPSKKDEIAAGTAETKEKEEDLRLKTLQTFCPITKMKLVEIPKDKLYLCPAKTCNTYYHYDAIAPMKKCINCGTPVSS